MSIELPDGKIVYNLPEQVSKNAKDIRKIADILDGINIQDNVVAIADISQILTRAELDIVEKPVAFLYYSDQLYIKRNEVGGSAFFDVIFSISGSTVISFNSKEIEVVLSTGALILTTSTVSTYSKTELDTQLGLKADTTYVDAQLATKANLSGATFSGNVKALTFEQTAPNYSEVINVGGSSGVTVTDIYSRFEVINNVLLIVFSFKMTNNTGSSKTLYSISSSNITINNPNIANAIYDVLGHTVSEAVGSNTLITLDSAFVANDSGFTNDAKLQIFNATNPNKISMTISNTSGVTIPDGEYRYITARTFLTLL